MKLQRALLWTATVVALALGQQFHDASQRPLPYVLLGIATLFPLAATFLHKDQKWLSRWPLFGDLVLVLAALGLSLEVFGQFTGLYRWAAQPHHPPFDKVALLVSVSVVLGAVGLAATDRVGRVTSAVMVIATVLLGLLIVHDTKPWIDVYLFHTRSVEALLHGQMPYGAFTPNIYKGMPFYAPEVLTPDGAQVHLGFPYPPLQLLLALAPQRLLGDYRYLHILAIGVSCALMLWMKPGMKSRVAVAVFLLAPWMILVMEQGWTEPLLVLFFSLTMVAALRAPRMLPFALAGVFAIKQYAVALAPLVFLLVDDRKRAWRIVIQSGLLAAATLVPFALWDWRGLVNDLVLFLVRQPLRPDSYNWTSLVWTHWRVLIPQGLAFASLVAAVLLTVWKGPRGPLGFASGTMLGFTLFFGFSKHAFYNYWFFLLAVAAWALVLSDDEAPVPALTPAAVSK
ncbi:MAG: hypothetical protein JST92_04895 [Deltaproteobacteria bacterium]|nr:hypothetical protein [Deltaproteobacteria bacterium]